MPRLRFRRRFNADDSRYDLDLAIGTDLDFTDEELAELWKTRREHVLKTYGGHGSRPWAMWHFDIGEPKPERKDEAIRLAELGLLTNDERADIARKAAEAEPRIGTGDEHISALGTRFEQRWDREAVALDAKVSELP